MSAEPVDFQAILKADYDAGFALGLSSHDVSLGEIHERIESVQATLNQCFYILKHVTCEETENGDIDRDQARFQGILDGLRKLTAA